MHLLSTPLQAQGGTTAKRGTRAKTSTRSPYVEPTTITSTFPFDRIEHPVIVLKSAEQCGAAPRGA